LHSMVDEPEVYDDDDLRLGDWSEAIPEKMKRWTVNKLHFAQVQNKGGSYDYWATNELNRRQAKELADLITILTRTSQLTTEAVIGLTGAVNTLTEFTDVHIKVSHEVLSGTTQIAKSSHKLEWLTGWLIGLTVVLGLLTVVLVGDVVLKYWPERHLQLTAPQAPPLPAR